MNADNKRNWKKKTLGMAIVATIPITAYAISDSVGIFSSWVVVGSSGVSGGAPAITVGTGNISWGPSNIFSAGSYLVNYDDNSAVVGQWNADTGADEAFVVGVGTGSGDKKNALEVHKDGSVIINEEQGDISMGGFGN